MLLLETRKGGLSDRVKVEEKRRWEAHGKTNSSMCPWRRAQPAALSLVAGSSQRGFQQSTRIGLQCLGFDVCPLIFPSFQPPFPFTLASSEAEKQGFLRPQLVFGMASLTAIVQTLHKCVRRRKDRS